MHRTRVPNLHDRRPLSRLGGIIFVVILCSTAVGLATGLVGGDDSATSETAAITDRSSTLQRPSPAQWRSERLTPVHAPRTESSDDPLPALEMSSSVSPPTSTTRADGGIETAFEGPPEGPQSPSPGPKAPVEADVLIPEAAPASTAPSVAPVTTTPPPPAPATPAPPPPQAPTTTQAPATTTTTAPLPHPVSGDGALVNWDEWSGNCGRSTDVSWWAQFSDGSRLSGVERFTQSETRRVMFGAHHQGGLNIVFHLDCPRGTASVAFLFSW